MIPLDLKRELASDPFYEKCAITGHRPVQWHHAFMFGGKSIQEKWAIVPLTKEIHDKVTPHNKAYDSEMEQRVLRIALNRATSEELLRYSKVIDLINLKKDLNEKSNEVCSV